MELSAVSFNRANWDLIEAIDPILDFLYTTWDPESRSGEYIMAEQTIRFVRNKFAHRVVPHERLTDERENNVIRQLFAAVIAETRGFR